MPEEQATTETAQGNPSKGFFIAMLTRDISLSDCILDLLDNCVDGINRKVRTNGAMTDTNNKYSGFWVTVKFDPNTFSISDNCGGISLDAAKNYAFRFGKPEDVIQDPGQPIGLYGIGMKRAMFKMGKAIKVVSSTGEDSFELDLVVDDWRKQPEADWTFKLSNVRRNATDVEVGTTISITELHPSVGREFGTPGFSISSTRAIKRDYAFILQHGLIVKVNDKAVHGTMPTFRESGEVAPLRVRRSEGEVEVEITGGLSASPPEDDSPEHRFPEAESYGWYVVCNDRVVVTADRTNVTGWGVGSVPAWHPQFYGFLGVAHFRSSKPQLLPWRTTKRDVDPSNELYKKALVLMCEAAKTFTDYTNRRKTELKKARGLESAAPVKPISAVGFSNVMKLPAVARTTMRRISYEKPATEVEAVARALRLRSVSAKEVGIRTFDYFVEREVEK